MRFPIKTTGIKELVTAAAVIAAVLLPACRRAEPSGAPRNEAAKVKIGKEAISVRYDGGDIFEGRIKAGEAGFEAAVNVFRTGKALSQVILLTPRDKGGKVRVEGVLSGGPESFPCEADRRDRGLIMVRHVSGTSRSALNRAVYDRGRD